MQFLLFFDLIGLAALFVAYGLLLIIRPFGDGIWGGILKALAFGPSLLISIIPGANSLQKWLSHQIGGTIQNLAAPWVKFLHALKQYHVFQSIATFSIAYDLYRFADWLINHHEPARDKSIVAKVSDIATIRTGKTTPITKVVVKERPISDARIRKAIAADFPVPLRRDINLIEWLRTHWKQVAAAAAAAGSIAIPFPHRIPAPALPRWLPRFKTNTEADLRKLKKILGRTGFIALLVTLGFPEIARLFKCKNTSRIAKSFCGANGQWLENLLLGIGAALVSVSILEFAQGMKTVVSGIDGLATTFWQVDLKGVHQTKGLG